MTNEQASCPPDHMRMADTHREEMERDAMDYLPGDALIAPDECVKWHDPTQAHPIQMSAEQRRAYYAWSRQQYAAAIGRPYAQERGRVWPR